HVGELHAALPSASPRSASSGIPSTTHVAGSSPFASRMASRSSGLEALAATRVPSGLQATHWPAYSASFSAGNAARFARNLRRATRYAGISKDIRNSLRIGAKNDPSTSRIGRSTVHPRGTVPLRFRQPRLHPLHHPRLHSRIRGFLSGTFDEFSVEL